MNFNYSKNTYRDIIDQSIKFTGRNLDFFTSVKADFLRRISRRFLPNISKPRLLDVGCGHGFIHGFLQEDNFDVVGIEVADEVLELAKKLNPNVPYVSYDGKTLPFQSESFDIAIAICVMHHVPQAQWDLFLVEMKRIIRPGGIVVIFEHNPYNPFTRYIVSNSILDKGVILLHNSRLKKMLLQSGFEVVSSRFIFFTPFASSIFRQLDRTLGWCSLGAQYYIVATR